MRRSSIRSLKTRMILYLSIVLAIAMLLSTAAAFLYFFNVTQAQQIKDEQAKLRLVAKQLDFKSEDVFNFANSIAVDSTIQEVLVRSEFPTEFARTKARQQVANRLVFYNTLRNFVITANILNANGDGYSSRGFQNSIYYEDKFSVPALKEYMRDTGSVFSACYVNNDANTPTEVVCYKLPIRSIQSPSLQIGTLYLEIRASYFQAELQQFAQSYNDLLWSNADGRALYRKQASDASELTPQPGAQRIAGGYLISETAPRADWIVGIVLTDAQIRAQASWLWTVFALFFVLTLALMLLTINPVLSRIIRPITALTDVMGTVREGNLAVQPRTDTHDEIALLYQGFNDMIADIRQYIQRERALEQQKREMEFHILISQVNPHYLYNVLNTVAYLAAAEHNTRIVEVVNAQIRILQQNLKVGENIIYTTVLEEMVVIDSYLTIQKYRYPELFAFRAEIEEGLLDHLIPKAILQPLVENALYHGIVPKDEMGNIELRGWMENGRIVFTVRDDGMGMVREEIERFHSGEEIKTQSGGRKHIGLVNARERIRFLYGEAYGIHIESEAEAYTLIRIELPA